MTKLLKVLRFLRVTDEQDNLSLTNLSVMLMMGKILTTPALSMQDVAIAIVPLLNYAHKRHVGGKNEV